MGRFDIFNNILERFDNLPNIWFLVLFDFDCVFVFGIQEDIGGGLYFFGVMNDFISERFVIDD